jgi:hypothetical protein
MDNRVENLSNFEKNLLVQWFMYRMEWSERKDLMENFPMIYYKMTGVKAPIWKEEKANNE